jgi:hypothetical protein
MFTKKEFHHLGTALNTYIHSRFGPYPSIHATPDEQGTRADLVLLHTKVEDLAAKAPEEDETSEDAVAADADTSSTPAPVHAPTPTSQRSLRGAKTAPVEEPAEQSVL